MLLIVGFIVVVVTVFGGFVLEGGHLSVLLQPVELLIIFGAAFGSMLISSPMSLIKRIMKQVLSSPKNAGFGKDEYTQLLLLLYELCKIVKTNPLSLEPHIEAPENSEIFKKYPSILKNHHLVAFLSDTMKVQLSSSLPAYDLEELMETDIEATHAEEMQAPTTIARLGDSMPGLGIVAAVLGVVITMGKLTQGKEVIGHSVGAALVGTFLGVLGAYGFMAPLAAKMESNIADDGHTLYVVKAALIALAKECSPKVCVEFARRRIPPKARPSFEEIDKATSAGGRSAEKAAA
ncbi:MAG TPA: flagellar motor stator protein MotA [Bdellovibrionales bacterium]|nr:MAG: flagellar motor stator protein MotA [Bdellovibrionales bacterium GWB1_52_6]OFZ03280.1 MAG: flagellar motor stator protein MotA [Bdellovibrionales bacterium GWA1_52_35]OFZ40174.1 MAG: flagellar motor stator protein MotA [Bdellovibrionales bacterium GWC1_52_8]HAR43091.1 flagellar motor stator protein MotA [Bdellovibrionales bacterium]HCM40534.1 flagellar motor stator protein MotA [Bdellovibrionales bacterium]